MGKSSREKGKRGEREFCALLTKCGFPAHRAVQYKGGHDSGDISCEDLDPILHFEVKRVERLNLWEAMAQAVGDAGEGQRPVVAHRANHKPWLVTLKAEHFLALLQQAPR
jgi:Holliday junction resolvase